MRAALLIDEETFPAEDPTLSGASETICMQVEFHVAECLRFMGWTVDVIPLKADALHMVTLLKAEKYNLVFNLTEHWGGNRSHDAYITAMLELMGIPYTGSGPEALMLCRDKALSKQVLQDHGLRAPRFVLFDPGKTSTRRKLRFPVITKPAREDGSEGISQASLVYSQEEMEARIRLLHTQHSQPVICEEYIEGRELYIGIIGNARLTALPAREVRFNTADEGGPTIATARVKQDEAYRQKWNIEYGHADIPPQLQQRAAAFCKKAYRVLGIRDYGRIDLRVDAKGHIYFLEANANPDLTMGDELAEAWGQSGKGDYQALIQTIVRQALSRKSR